MFSHKFLGTRLTKNCRMLTRIAHPPQSPICSFSSFFTGNLPPLQQGALGWRKMIILKKHWLDKSYCIIFEKKDHIYIYIFIPIHKYMHMYIYVNINIITYICTYVCVYIYICYVSTVYVSFLIYSFIYIWRCSSVQ